MNPSELATALKRLDWSATSLQHQLAVSCAVETLKGTAPMTPTQAELDRAFPSNVTPFPTRTRWTTLHQLDGRPWATSAHFGPEGAWGWIVETVAHEWSVSEDAVGSLEGVEDVYDGDDLVTIDGLPAYRLRHKWRG